MKLVRDRIPEIIEASGEEPIITIAKPDDVWGLLIAKLHEEVDELAVARPERLIEELADIAEMLDTIVNELHIDPRDVARVQKEKNYERGRFTKKLVWHGNKAKG